VLFHNFFVGVFGLVEGRGAFSAIERFISQISEEQKMPMFDRDDQIYDLSAFLNRAA